jgi:hypothetical protein
MIRLFITDAVITVDYGRGGWASSVNGPLKLDRGGSITWREICQSRESFLESGCKNERVIS